MDRIDDALVERMVAVMADSTCVPWAHTPEDEDDDTCVSPRSVYRKCALAALREIGRGV
jgi:hypothetical protein